ncbi:SDR family NAD(P)-dependent oxidoreductase [Acetobacter sp. LMG 1636]|uniref:SDR family NAD(P)-dependent oxidoreductase n=2 Tax=Acetobacter fallax TaxID=1737473 RepID=A0ABX0KIR6_9PROT|nr:SDR family NAD(P)-dependent oxidoreductase [Acetobacter fallax]NHO37343.1 SDR family NAD(P)-dependent oxidoreductase [Acetobacter fallax]
MSHSIAVVTGAGAGVGRATARALGRAGFDVALLGRNETRLSAAAVALERAGARALCVPVDVSDAAAVEAAADRVEAELGPVALWVNCAGATVTGPVAELDAADVRRATEVTYLGTVYGTMAALRRMRRRGKGVIVNLDLAPRLQSLPMQAAESGARGAVRGFCESLRTEILHDGDRIRVALVHLPALNTPRYGWTRNLTGRLLRPVAPVYEPEVAGEAICRAAFYDCDEVWIGVGGQVTRALNAFLPRMMRRRRARLGYYAQMESMRAAADAPSDLDVSVPGSFSAHGHFDQETRKATSLTPVFLCAPLPRFAKWLVAGAGGLGMAAGLWHYRGGRRER